jgi:hypothetical protein
VQGVKAGGKTGKGNDDMMILVNVI